VSSVDLREFLDAFVTEVSEHLQSATDKLVGMEAAARRGEPTLRHVRDVFRALHTVKGLAAMVGVEPIVTIAHRMESILRDADRSAKGLPADTIDALLEGVRAIDTRVKAANERRTVPEPPAPLLARLDGLEAGGAPAPKAAIVQAPELEPAIAQKLSPADKEHLAHGLASGRSVFRADFFPSPARAEQGFTINLVRERVSALGELIKVVPLSVAPSEHAPGGLAFVLHVVTDASREQIAAAVGIAPEAIVALSESRPAVSEAAPLSLDPEEEWTAAPARRGVVRVDVTRLDEAMDRLSALVVSRFRLVREVTALAAKGVDVRGLRALLAEHARQIRDLRAALVHVRMVPIAEILDRVPMIVRSLRRSTGKQVRLEMDGGHAELDKAVAERLFPALVHLVRNAVDHAIETPDERRRRGKPEEGRVQVTCSQHSNSRLVLAVSDDGRGIDREMVARRAGAAVPDTDAELLDLLCRPGLSTREEASTTSGRGMGMDIIRRVAVDQLGGELLLQTKWGEGTTFTLVVPLTISIVDAFTFECSGQHFVVPVAIVEEIVEVPESTSRVSSAGGDAMQLFQRRGESVPLVPLDRVFRLGSPAESAARKAIVVRRAGEPIAFAVDRMLGQQEVVVRPLEDPLVQVPGVTGATDLGDGLPTLVIDLVALGGAVRGRAIDTKGESAGVLHARRPSA
jgi:two-component system chemotaxis sensor kinase CheA